tara:strand:+ start:681 stop:806 length:126 start_codon:yes stop_codon:yes gene_type:complete
VAEDRFPAYTVYTVSFLLVTPEGFRRKAIKVFGGGPFDDGD